MQVRVVGALCVVEIVGFAVYHLRRERRDGEGVVPEYAREPFYFF